MEKYRFRMKFNINVDLYLFFRDIISVSTENKSNLNIFQGIKSNMDEIGKIFEFEKTTINCNYGFKVNIFAF